jgi:uncharacterized phage protein gp47/JayE
MTELTELGFNRTRLDELLVDLQNGMIGIFGADIDLEPDTLDGQLLGIFAESQDNLTMLAEDVYHSFNPQTALGVALSRLVQLNGIRRIEGRYSTCVLKLGGVNGTSVPVGSLVRNPATNQVFQTITQGNIDGTGFAFVNSQALTFGPITAPIGTITKIDNPVFGWQTVTNDVAAIPGRTEETDEQLRIRRSQSTSTPAQSILESLEGALQNLASVVQAVVLENYTNAVDSNGTPAHGIHAIVQGGTDAEIAQTIWLRKSLGCDMLGAVSINITDSVGVSHTMKFDRPTLKNVFIIVNVVKKAGWPTTGDQMIKDNIVAWAIANQSIGEEVIQSRLYVPVNDVPGHSITTLFLGFAASPTTETNLAIAFNELASFDQSRIVVNVT